MRSQLVLIVACLVVLGTECQADEWYRGLVHLHTTFSDGAMSPEVLAGHVRAQNGQFMIVADHYGQIGEPKKGLTPLAVLQWFQAGLLADVIPDGPFGFENYNRLVSGLTDEGVFVAVPGAEIDSTWFPEPGNEASAHTLAIGAIREADHQVIDEYCGKPDHQQDIINKIIDWGMLPVAAHPSLLHRGTPGDLSKVPGVGRIDYRYDKRPASETADIDGNFRDMHYRGLAGVEMWNARNSEQYEDDVEFYLRLIREGFSPVVTSGSDFHAGLGLMDRVTGVYASGLTTADILGAIAAGKTYAAQHGARLASMSPSPGEHVTADKPTVRATVTFPSPTGSAKEFVVYRDGIEAPGSRAPKPAGRTSYEYEWTDGQADGKEHSYVLRVGEVLITSPAWVAGGGASNDRQVCLVVADANRTLSRYISKGGEFQGSTSITARDSVGSVSLSPDGAKVAWAEIGSESGALCVSSASTLSEPLRIAGTGGHPYWTPDGRSIIAMRTGQLWSMRADGSEAHRLWSSPSSRILVSGGLPSPDGGLLVLEQATHWSVVSVIGYPDASHATDPLVGGCDLDYDWEPEGSALLVTIDFDGSRESRGLYRITREQIEASMKYRSVSGTDVPRYMLEGLRTVAVQAVGRDRCFVVVGQPDKIGEPVSGGHIIEVNLTTRQTRDLTPPFEGRPTWRRPRPFWCDRSGTLALMLVEGSGEGGPLLWWRTGMDNWAVLAQDVVSFSCVELAR